ncbi:Sphingomyelin phosphodiesterase [Geodia barretti]|uniref:Sphingomyelin phosphodiesterase n=1 Tax=Geodia barretti TaxID=519541 RepID=A0AA35SJK9_GEOBA|nr:Sphingomyelin phosphodiesterase [Geodia barretti]
MGTEMERDHSWRKPPVVPVNPPKPGSPTNRILFLTDMHWDPYYTPGLTNDCGEPLCCRPPNPKATNESTAAGNWGDYQCDVPYRTLESLMQFIAGMSDEFDWVYWTGDLPAHYVWNQTRENQLYIMDTLCDMMKQYLPDKIVFPSLGNHEGVPVNAFPPPFVTGENGDSWLLTDASRQWYSWLSQLPDWDTTHNTITYGGFYNVRVREGLRVISLQTNFANSGNYWLLINSTDPAGQLKWLVEQLLQAERDVDKVHIIGHIFPSSYMKEFGWNYHKIVTRFESTITGQFFGHTHQDSWQVFFDDSNRTRATNVAYMGPAVTTYQGLNLGFRIYTMDGNYNGTSNALLDHESYWLNLTEANLKDKAEWKFEYSAKEAYGLGSLQPQEWARLIDRFKTDDALFQKFWE